MPVVLCGFRFLSNLFRHRPSKKLILANASCVLDAASDQVFFFILKYLKTCSLFAVGKLTFVCCSCVVVVVFVVVIFVGIVVAVCVVLVADAAVSIFAM